MGDSVHISIIDHADVTPVEKVDRKHTVRAWVHLGKLVDEPTLDGGRRHGPETNVARRCPIGHLSIIPPANVIGRIAAQVWAQAHSIGSQTITFEGLHSDFIADRCFS